MSDAPVEQGRSSATIRGSLSLVRPPEKISHQQVAEAGEHYCLYRLYQWGFVGGQAPRGMAKADLLVMQPEGGRAVRVQVKTRLDEPRDGGWHMQAKHEQITGEDLWYAFVGLEEDPPLTYVIPSATVAAVISRAHAAWLAIPGRGGRERRDNKLRRLCPDYGHPVPGYPQGWIDQFRDAWDLLAAVPQMPATGPG